MAKLTLAFKDRKLKIFAIPSGDCLIGRDPDCLVAIDSLAVEPQHARLTTSGECVSIEPCSENTSVLVNDTEITASQQLVDGDEIRIGKHTLGFSEEQDGVVLESAAVRQPATGWLQILSGSHLGRTIRLDKAFTRIGKSDVQLAVIARRDDGFHISHLQGTQTPSINGDDIGDATRRLNHADEIAIGELKVQFFADNQSAEDPNAVGAAAAVQQRQFSRIPFDVAATLRGSQQQWDTSLIDISLHGALVKVPADFQCETDQVFQLSVHLEGGPDITMEVSAAHHEHEQLGLRCRDIDVDSITLLRRLVEMNLGDPQLLERELQALG
ncbi:MAG: FHA domain-containing protein [Thiogranum sp.]|nr:FHA domain-containing protein [Thiogranum sp.]